MNIKDRILEATILLKKYFELLFEEWKLEQIGLGIKVMSTLMVALIIGFFSLIIGTLLVLALSFYYIDVFQSVPQGILASAGTIFLVLLILLGFQKSILIRPIRSWFVKMINTDV